MATAIPEISTGTTVSWDTFFGNITNLTVDVSQPVIDITTFASTGGREKMAGDLTDATFTGDILFDATDAPAFAAAATAFTITWPGATSPNTLTGNAIISSISISAPNEDVITATVEIAVSGAITWG